MPSVSDVVAELNGTGLTHEELFEISKELTEFTISRYKLQKRLAESFDEEELNDILLTIEAASFQERFMAEMFDALSPREKQCYVMNVVEGKSFGNIAKELGIHKTTVQQSIERSREKIEVLKGIV